MGKPKTPPRTAPAKEPNGMLEILEGRFAEHMDRHPDVSWAQVQERLERAPAKLAVLEAMEATGGEPDVVGRDAKTGEIRFVDCAAQSPKGRFSLCYDREARDQRKEHKPRSSAIEMAAEMGVELLSEDEYFALQELGEFDTKTSSWLRTPPEIRRLGGAIFGDRRFGRVFIYHNGAESYYNGRGFRGSLRV